jgi:hypothetical protein
MMLPATEGIVSAMIPPRMPLVPNAIIVGMLSTWPAVNCWSQEASCCAMCTMTALTP